MVTKSIGDLYLLLPCSFIDKTIHQTCSTTIVSEKVSQMNVYLVKAQQILKIYSESYLRTNKTSQIYFQMLHPGKISIKYVIR